MKTSVNELQTTLKQYLQEELTDYLGAEVNSNDLDGIKENVMKDIDNRINEYIETTQEGKR